MTDSLARIRAYSAANPFGAAKPRAARVKKAPGARKAPEFKPQVKMVVWLRRHLPEGSQVWHTPNGEVFRHAKGNSAAIFHLMAMGLLPGIPDILATIPCAAVGCDGKAGEFHAHAFGVEAKSAKGSLTKSQKYLFPLLRTLGIPVLENAKSVEDVQAFLAAHNISLTLVRF